MLKKYAILAIILVIVFSSTVGCQPYLPSEPSSELPLEPPPDTPADLRFIVFGNSYGDTTATPVSLLFYELLEQVDEEQAAFCFHTGNFYLGGMWPPDVGEYDEQEATRQANMYLEAVGGLDIPCYHVIGSRECQSGGRRVCIDSVFQGKLAYYSFDEGNCHFVVLDSFDGGWHQISQKEFDWLKDDLQNTDKPHVFVFIHSPLYPMSECESMVDQDPQMRDALAALLLRHKVDVVFSGREAFYGVLQYNGLLQVITGGAGAPLSDYKKKKPSELGYNPDEVTGWKVIKSHHHLIVEVRGEEVTIIGKNLDGGNIDWFTASSS